MSDETQNLIDRFSEATGKAVSWLTLVMVVVTFAIVVMRYVFDAGLIWLQESVIWLHAAVFMLGAAYTLKHDEHVRVDVFYRTSSAKHKAWVDLLGVLLFLLPVCGFLLIKSWDFAAVSWSIEESSRESGGLPYPLIPMAKSILVAMPFVVGLQGISILLKSIVTIRRGS